MHPSKETPDLLSQVPVEIRAGFPLLVFDPRRLTFVKLPVRELLLAFSHDALVLSLLVRVSREAVGGGSDVSPGHLSSTLWDMLVEQRSHVGR